MEHNTNPYPTFPQFPDTGAGRYARRTDWQGPSAPLAGGDVAFPTLTAFNYFAGGAYGRRLPILLLTPYNFEILRRAILSTMRSLRWQKPSSGSLRRKRVALIIAECGSGKTKIGSTALGALHGLWADQKRKRRRTNLFGIVMCPSHVTQKWVREIGETLPDTYGMVVHDSGSQPSVCDVRARATKVYLQSFPRSARDGYMRYPAVKWSKRLRLSLP